MLFAANLHEHFINEEGIAVTLMLSLQAPGVFRSKLDAPKANGFIADRNSAFSQEIFDIAVAEIESIVQPYGVLDDSGWKSVTLVYSHARIIKHKQLICQYTKCIFVKPRKYSTTYCL